MLSLNELITEMVSSDRVFLDRSMIKDVFPTKNEELLQLVLSKDFWMMQDQNFREKMTGRTLSDLLNAKGGKSAVVGERIALAQRMAGAEGNQEAFCVVSQAKESYKRIFARHRICPNFRIQDLPGVYAALLAEPECPVNWLADNSSKLKRQELIRMDKELDLIRKAILYLYGKRQYAEFFWWLSVMAVLQSEIVWLLPHIPQTQYAQLQRYQEAKNNVLDGFGQHSLVQLSEHDFFDLRRKIVETAEGRLILAGPSLKNAFDVGNRHSIMSQLRKAVCSGRLNEITVFLTDPLLFFETRCYAPVRVIDSTVSVLEDYFYELCERNHVRLHICFMAIPQIDHVVISEEFMLYCSNKLWTDERSLKGSYMLHVADYYSVAKSEYRAHIDYLNLIIAISDCDPQIETDFEDWDRQDVRYYHRQWRKHLTALHYSYISFSYLHSSHLRMHMIKTWLPTME